MNGFVYQSMINEGLLWLLAQMIDYLTGLGRKKKNSDQTDNEVSIWNCSRNVTDDNFWKLIWKQDAKMNWHRSFDREMTDVTDEEFSHDKCRFVCLQEWRKWSDVGMRAAPNHAKRKWQVPSWSSAAAEASLRQSPLRRRTDQTPVAPVRSWPLPTGTWLSQPFLYHLNVTRGGAR